MKIRLSRQDLHEADLLAKDTVFLLENLGISARLKNERQSRINANRIGFMAEFAVCRLFETALPRLNISTDGGVDLWLDDIGIDVKFTKTGKLIFDDEGRFKAHLSILATESDEDDCINLIGWIGRKEFFEIATTHDFGYGDRLVVDASQLKPLEQLWREVKERKFK